MRKLAGVRARQVRVGDLARPCGYGDYRRVVKVDAGDCHVSLRYDDGDHDNFGQIHGWLVDIKREPGPELKWDSLGFGIHIALLTPEGEFPRIYYRIDGSPRRGWHAYLVHADGSIDGARELWSDYGPGVLHLKARAAEHYRERANAAAEA